MEARPASDNVLVLLEAAAERVPDRPALVFGDGAGETLTFSELWGRAGRIGAGLQRAGLEPGERAIVMIPMSPDLYAALLGVLKMGAVAVFVDPWIGARQIAAFAAFARPSAYLGTGKSHLLRLWDRRLRSLRLSITTGRRLGPLPARRRLAELASDGNDGGAARARADDPALITFTSGSSGLPKGANRTHGFLAAQHRALAEEFPCRDDDVDMPMFPIFALNNLALGIPSVIPAMDFRRVDRVDAATILRQMARHRVTTATASPPFFDRLADHLARTPGQRPRLRRILTGGAPVGDRQLERWRELLPDTEIVVAYGSTEAEPVAHISADERLTAAGEGQEAAGFCVGRPSARVATRVVPISRRPLPATVEELPPGEIGELLVSGDHVCKDYYRNPEAVRENKWRDAAGRIWHRMGDTGTFDDRGRFWLVGRVHSTIFRDGQAVHAQLVEQLARRLAGEGVGRVAAVGLPDPELGERVVLVLEGALDDAGRERLAAGMRRAGQEVDEIVGTRGRLPLDPRHRSKIDYAALRESLPGARRRRPG